MSQHLARAVAYHQGRDRDFLSETLRVSAGDGLGCFLEISVDRGRDGGLIWQRHREPFGEMRRKRREVAASARDGLRDRRFSVRLRYRSGRGGSPNNAIAPIDKGLVAAIRAAHFRRLRDRYQERGLGYAEPLRLFPEIGKRSCADTFEITAIGSELEIEREDLTLTERPLKARGVCYLLELGGDGVRRGASEQARHLHRQRRSA